MTRKDFELIAKAVRTAREHDRYSNGLAEVTQLLAEALATTNPSFNSARFISACLPE